MSRDRIWDGLLAGLLLTALLVAGCGKKDDPMPPQVKLPVVSDLTAVSRPEGIALSWTVAIRPEGSGGFKILRSVTVRAEDACPGCPQEHRPLREVRLGDGTLARDSAGSFRYLDGDVRTGSYYSYRVAACDTRGRCGEASKPSAVTHAGR